MAQADLKGRLPELALLDVSQNENLDTVYDTFFSHSAQLKNLKRLIVDKVEGFDNYTKECYAFVNLEEVKFHCSGEGIFNQNCHIRWQYLVKIEISCTLFGVISALTS